MKRLIYIIILLILAICFVSCRTQYIPVESVRTEYKTRDSIRFDSIYQRDKYLYRYLTTNRTDTILKHDSIPIPYPVEKQLSRWQTIKMELGGWAFGIIILFTLIIIGQIIFKSKK